jgi:transaldolase
MIADGLRGMTSNPTIFEHAIGHTSDYDQDLTALANSARTDRDIFETLTIEDVRDAADVFRAVFDSTEGGDGFVSLEVSPQLARDTDGSVADARRLWKALDRPNDDDAAGGQIDDLNTNKYHVSNQRRMDQEKQRRQ